MYPFGHTGFHSVWTLDDFTRQQALSLGSLAVYPPNLHAV
jgi:hypothetical protein